MLLQPASLPGAACNSESHVSSRMCCIMLKGKVNYFVLLWFFLPIQAENIRERVLPANLKLTFIYLFFFWKILFIYLREGERARTQASRGSHRGRGRRSKLPAQWGTHHGTQFQGPGITTWAKSKCLTNWLTQEPQTETSFYKVVLVHFGTNLLGPFLS